jgi:sugar lactone lactonase YvrE
MKNKQTETKFKSALGVACYLISRAVCLGAVILICSSASAQNLFMSDGYSGIARNLGHIYKIPRDGMSITFASGLNGPLGLAFDSTGNLFVASFGGTILKFTPGGRQSTFASGLNDPLGLAFDSTGNLFVADSGSGSIYKFTPSGVRTTFASGLNGPCGLAFDHAGNLFVASSLDRAILKFTPGGVRDAFASLSSPFDLAFDSAGNLFVTAWDGGHIYKFTPDGVRSTFAELGAPEGLAFDRTGNLFVVDEDTGNIFRFTPDGVRGTFAEAVGLGMDEVAFLAFQPTPTTSSSGRLQNISTRAFGHTGDNAMIGGFIITGSGQKKVILRAIGPSLINHGITHPLQNPTLELHDHTGALIASNDNWIDAPNKQEIMNSGLAPTNNLESAILMSLSPGAYTAIVRGVSNGTGIALVEGYDLDPAAGSKLGNISTRALVQTGDNVMIGGLIMVGPGSDKVLVRAIGPSLAQKGITNPLADPMLELHDGNGTLLASNDNWKDTQQAQIQATGLAPTNDAESAIVQTLEPGNYTAIVRGKNDTIGVALVEVYGLN